MSFNMNAVSVKCLKEYQERINKALEYIEVNGGQKLNLENLAGVSCFSPYHFHRIFHAIMGETLHGYIKRQRLAKACHLLLYDQALSITEIGIKCGFSSHSDFCRCFRESIGLSPGQYVKNKAKAMFSEERMPYPSLPAKATTTFSWECMDSIRQSTLPDLTVAYIRCSGLSEKLENPQINRAFSRLFAWAKARGLISEHTLALGLYPDSPEITPMEKCRYDACITLSQSVLPEGVIGVRTLPSAGHYVSFTYSRSSPEAAKQFFGMADCLYGHWLPENGFLPSDQPFIEIYRKDPYSTEILTDFHIPIKPI